MPVPQVTQFSMSQILGVVVGLAFTYLLLSLICTGLNEVMAWALELRAKTLRNGIAILLGEPGPKKLWKRVWAWISFKTPTGPLVNWLYDHALVKGLGQGQPLPSYIPSRTFALAIVDRLKDEAVKAGKSLSTDAAPAGPLAEAHVVQQIKSAIKLLPNEDVSKALNTILDESVTDLDGARTKIATWYDDAMDRVTGWYKRRAQFQTWICAFLVVFAVNADTIVIGRALWKDPVLRAEVQGAAMKYVEEHQPPAAKSAPAPASTGAAPAPTGAAPAPTGTAAAPTGTAAAPTGEMPAFPKDSFKSASAAYSELVADRLPIGWHYAPPYLSEFKNVWHAKRVWLYKLLGLLLTVLALSQGAPFWFDLLSKTVRSSGPRPAKASDGDDEG
jgi:hypothetical protein